MPTEHNSSNFGCHDEVIWCDSKAKILFHSFSKGQRYNSGLQLKVCISGHARQADIQDIFRLSHLCCHLRRFYRPGSWRRWWRGRKELSTQRIKLDFAFITECLTNIQLPNVSFTSCWCINCVLPRWNASIFFEYLRSVLIELQASRFRWQSFCISERQFQRYVSSALSNVPIMRMDTWDFKHSASTCSRVRLICRSNSCRHFLRSKSKCWPATLPRSCATACRDFHVSISSG